MSTTNFVSKIEALIAEHGEISMSINGRHFDAAGVSKFLLGAKQAQAEYDSDEFKLKEATTMLALQEFEDGQKGGAR